MFDFLSLSLMEHCERQQISYWTAHFGGAKLFQPATKKKIQGLEHNDIESQYNHALKYNSDTRKLSQWSQNRPHNRPILSESTVHSHRSLYETNPTTHSHNGQETKVTRWPNPGTRDKQRIRKSKWFETQAVVMGRCHGLGG
jgi:hypothetical protein